ncbi:MAG: hypothetical protein ACYS8Z_03570 [Planctomycetota bacterium]
MRNVLGLSAIIWICMALSSCSGNRPEKAFMGTWEGTNEGKTVEISFMEKDIFIMEYSGQSKAGTWTIDPEGNAVMAIEDGKAVATVMNDGRLIAREEDGGNAVVLEKAGKKK